MSLGERLVEAGAAGGGVGGGFYMIRWLMRWFTERVDRRQAQLDSEHAALDESWKDYRTKLETRLKNYEAVVEQVGAIRLAFELVAGELRKVDPYNGVLRRTEQLLTAAFPLLPAVAPEAAPPAVLAGLDHLPEVNP